MAVTEVADRAYRQLSPRIRGELLARFRRLGGAPDELSGLKLIAEDQRRLEQSLEIIFALSDAGAHGYVQDGLRDLDWTVEQFKVSAGALERAAELFLADEDRARDAFKWWNANAIVRSATRSDGFQLPEYAVPVGLGENDESKLKGLIQSALSEHRGGAEIVECRVRERPSPWRGAGGVGTAIQIDVKCGNEPEQVEIAVDGRAVFQSFNFVSTIVIVIDTARGSIHVGSSEGRKRLRSGLAATVFQHFWKRVATLETLPALPVHPSQFSTKPEFGKRPGAVKKIAVSELWYEVTGQPGLKRALIADTCETDIYNAPELSDTVGIAIYRARITIWFKAEHRGDQDRRRILTLLHPNTSSFPHFTLAEQQMAERLLMEGGYMDAAPSRGSAGTLDQLDTLSTPDNSNRVRQTLGETWYDAFEAIRVVHDGDRSEFAFCEQCLQHHLSDGPDPETPGREILHCQFGDVSVAQEAFRTSGFSRRRLAAWVCEQLGTDVIAPHEQDGFLWDAGMFARPGKGGRLRVVLAFDLSSNARFTALTQRASGSRAQPTVVLTFAKAAAGALLQNEWKVVSLADVVTLEEGQLTLSTKDVAQAFDGKGRKRDDVRRKPMDWTDVFSAFREIDDGQLGHYEIANLLVERFLDRWPVDADTIARRLKKEYPERFSDQGGPRQRG